MRLQVTLVKLLAVLALVSTVVVSGAAGAAAQVMVSPDAEPVRNDGGWIYWLAVALMVVGLIAAVAVAFAYMRRAPRFQRDESARKTVKAERIQPGAEVPRRPVNVSGAPAIVPPPTRVLAAVAAPAAVAASTPAPAPAPATAPAAASPAPAPVAQEPVEPAAAASAPAPVPTAEQATAAPAAAAEHKEVALDQETFDRVLAELLEKGTTRRVAEGQARRAAMIAARKKAGG